MPNRIIRESIRTSPTLNQISAEAHRLWSHLVTVADDEGRFLADAGIVLANCFPLKIGTLRPQAVEKWLRELDRAHLILLYFTDKKDRRYGQFITWKKHNPRCRYGSKWPAPPQISDYPPNGKHVESAPVADCGPPLANRGRPHTSSSIHHTSSSIHSREKRSAVADNGHLSHDEWFEKLRRDPKYTHIDLAFEDQAMDRWLAKHPGRKKTRAFVTHWLDDKDEPPVKSTNPPRQIKPKSFQRMQAAEADLRRPLKPLGEILEESRGGQ